MGQRDDFTDMALGLVSAQSFPAIVGIADHMLKSSGVTLVGYEKIGSGHCTAIVRGSIADVRLAVQEGAERAEQFGQTLATLVVPRPMPNLEVVLPIGNRLAQLATGRGHSKLSNQAVGLLETRGFPAMVGAADAMLKSADVVLAAYETIGAGLCTAIVRGSVANVAMALDVGMAEAERIGELHAVMLVPRPLDDLDQTLPLASCWIEELQPLRIPLSVKETQKDVVALPELKQEIKELTAPANDRSLPESSQPEQELLPLNDKKPLKQPLEQSLEQPVVEPVPLPVEIDSASDAPQSTISPAEPKHPKQRPKHK
ncbi:MAG: BMC domain-containing protein [Leptolyngbyaceae cyanobacterium RU_5_1]|nr:BMC domain-containing protein [Leptolyngbyaceae cyanobacterium RU_5_1]